MRRRTDVAIVIVVAAVAHFTYFALRYGSFYFPDSFTYLNAAKNLLHGLGFVSGHPLEIETVRTPGYPLLLTLFGAHTLPVIILQHLLAIALAAALFLFVLQRLASRLAAYAAAFLFALDTPTILVSNKILTETLFTAFLFAVFLMMLQERPRVIVMALLIGVMVLVRPVALFFFVVVALRIPRRRLLSFVACALLLPVAWAARNWAQTRVFTVSSIGAINLLGQRAAGALAIEDDEDFRTDLAVEQRELAEDADDFIQRTLHIPDAEELPVAVRAKYYGTYAMRIIAQHPVALLKLTARGIFVNLFDSASDAMAPVCLLRPFVLHLVLGAVPVIAFLFAVIGVIALWNRDRRLAIAVVMTVGYFIVISAGGEAEARFRVPVIPQIAIAAAAGFDLVRRAAAIRW